MVKLYMWKRPQTQLPKNTMLRKDAQGCNLMPYKPIEKPKDDSLWELFKGSKK